MPRLLLFLLSLLSLTRAAAQDPDALRQRFQDMRTTYAERVERFETEFAELEKQAVNRLIIALVRTEQAYRDEGDLIGVLQTRSLQEELLETRRFPDDDPEFLEKIKELLEEPRQDLGISRQEIQERLDAFRQSYAERLEPVMRDLTRAGDFETAREILDIRNQILASLDLQQGPRPTHRTPDQLRASNDPNTFPLILEADALRNHSSLGTRRAQLSFQPRTEGRVETGPRGIQFAGGRFTIPAHAGEALIHQVRQTHSFTLEIGFLTSQRIQNATIFSMGPDLGNANLALLHQGENLTLLLRTTVQGGETVVNRVDLGPANEGRLQHLIITYRPGDLAVYRNGSNTRRNRADASGDLRGWEMQPVHFGHTDIADPAAAHPRWNGTLVAFYMSATPVASRQVTTSFERFVSFITNR
ncbi:MAG: hypothetical protein JJU05_18435 [Verrucomicrobia bacterium]|nr:hypothetical protein [Verrucomicrobiota bacterium]